MYGNAKGLRELPGGLTIKTQCFYCGSSNSIPGWGAEILQAMRCGKKIREREKEKKKYSEEKNLPEMQETCIRFLGQEDPLEKGMVTHSSILAWRIPQMEEPGGLQSMGSQRVGHDLAIKGLCAQGTKPAPKLNHARKQQPLLQSNNISDGFDTD